MSVRRAIVVGAGKRVREAALPAFQRASELFEVDYLVARSEREEEVGGVRYPVRALDSLTREDLAGVDLVFLCVAKDAIPEVLARLAQLEPGGTELLIDTPVVRFKHYRHVRHLEAFARVGVAEDCTSLPWIPLVQEALRGGDIGALRAAIFQQSAWAYHGLAMAKTLLGETRVRSARRSRLGGEVAMRRIVLGKKEAIVLEPRDYSVGRLLLVGEAGTIGDYEHGADGARVLEPILAGGICRGFRLGERESLLDEAESSLMTGLGDASRVTPLMEASKKVGFLRLLRRIHAGEGAYPLEEAIDDMVVDYHLEKIGRYVANPVTSPRSALGRFVLSTVTRAGG